MISICGRDECSDLVDFSFKRLWRCQIFCQRCGSTSNAFCFFFLLLNWHANLFSSDFRALQSPTLLLLFEDRFESSPIWAIDLHFLRCLEVSGSNGSLPDAILEICSRSYWRAAIFFCFVLRAAAYLGVSMSLLSTTVFGRFRLSCRTCSLCLKNQK